jgi:hypothetical protein
MEKETGNFSTQNKIHKEAVEEVQRILLNIQGQDNNAIILVQNTLGDLLNGILTPSEALKRARLINSSLLTVPKK